MKRTLFLLTALLLHAVLSLSASPDTLHYNIYFGDRLSGSSSVWQDETSWNSIFEYNDRGRGPYLREEIRLNKAKAPVYLHVTGHNYLKDTVNETFEIRKKQATWKSKSEQGIAAWGGTQFYSPANGSPMSMGILIRYLMAKEGAREADLLPGGKVMLNGVTEHRLADTLALNLVSLTGFAFNPVYVWTDSRHRVFAVLYGNWFGVIRRGYEAWRPQMVKLQEKSEEEDFRKLAQKVMQRPEKGLLIRNARLFDPETGNVQDNMAVLVTGNTIQEVMRDAEMPPHPEAKVVDAANAMLLPGMFDMHTHIGKTDGPLHLAAGVTSTRDMGNSLDLAELKKKFESNELPGPRIVRMCGFIDKAGPYAGPTGKIIERLDEGFEAITWYKNNGYEQIKLYSSIEPEWVKPLCDKAHSLGMKVSGHIPAFMTASQAVAQGYDEIQHINMLFLNFLPDTIDTRTPLRFTMVAEHGHTIDLEGAEFKAFAQQLKEAGTVVDPTVTIFEGMFTSRPGEADPAYAMIMDRLPVQVRRGFFGGGLPVPEGREQHYVSSFDRMLRMVAALHAQGITIVPGTDALAGFAYHRELENYVRAGIAPKEVLKMATLTAAQVSGVENRLGAIKPGMLADMILVEGDPTRNISDIRKIKLTVKDGNLYDPENIYTSIGVQPVN